MDKYLQQLIEDLKQILIEVNPSEIIVDTTVKDEDSFRRHIEDVESYLKGELKTVQEIVQLDQKMLPPEELLTDAQKGMLAKELSDFLYRFHFVLDFPETLPDQYKYKFIREFWEQEQPEIKYGLNHIEFCYYDKKDCPFPEYCTYCDDYTSTESLDDE